MQRLLRRKKLFLYTGIIALIGAGAVIPMHISVTLSPSLDHRVFYLDRGPFEVKKGDYVLFTKSYLHLNEGRPFNVIKKVACTEGNAFHNRGKDYYCNGAYLGRAKERSLKGEGLDNFEFNGVVPKGNLVVWGDHKDSLDTRYFGLLRTEEIKAVAYPLW